VTLTGLLLTFTNLGDPWVNRSYDYLFRFGTRPATNAVVQILMDNESYDYFGQERGQIWDRALHAQLLSKLAADNAKLVVIDSFFRVPRDPEKDALLAEAIRKHGRVVLMAEQAEIVHPEFIAARPTLPADIFLEAASNRWGVAWLDPDLDRIVRRHWPFPSPGPYPGLAWRAAELSGATFDRSVRERWLRYYSKDASWTRLSYRLALLDQAPGFFRDKVVFIGTQPATSVADGERDEFETPFTRWTAESSGGVEIIITAYLNLVNNEWLERAPWWMEALLVTAAGILSGGFLCRMRPMGALVTGTAGGIAVALGGVAWGHHQSTWVAWLVISGAQVPCALVWALLMPAFRRVRETITVAGSAGAEPTRALRESGSGDEGAPETPDYELVPKPFGEGAYGKVWLAKNAIGEWQALKVVYLSRFHNNPDPFEREFNGISRYKPVSDKHPGLLRVDFVSRKRERWFYYVMELADALEPGWEANPDRYRPRDLSSERRRAGGRLPPLECVRIGLQLTDALRFLHSQGLIHRDIKPSNILFVKGRPKLGDVGLISEIRPPDRERTFVGTPGYMPPSPERPGTVQADIYSLGMVLYVMATGRDAGLFPEIATTLIDSKEAADYLPLNSVILKACDPDRSRRYATADEMHAALLEAGRRLEESPGIAGG